MDSMVLKFSTHDPPSEHVERADVTSKAVVKYTEANLPSTFKQLKQDTDLNSAPDNWLRSSLAGKFLEGSIQKKAILDLSSFSMTRNYLDYVGKIDVISDAENIRSLLKTPYSDGSLSMAVHRVRNTLLINELDIPKIISAASEQNPELEPKLEWLKNLYCDVINLPRDSQFSAKTRNQEQARSQSILSKFLHHSIAEAEGLEMPLSAPVDLNIQPEIQSHEENFEQLMQQNNLYQTEKESAKFEPKPSFKRNMLWTFEDITMLVGSNMPIFGGGRFPAVSLRLRDAQQPVNILTGLDYWLDNLMCNVPELVMCYHLEGIVQKYEVIKTEDLPKLDECRFSPKVVKDIAQDILSFLKSKCTQEGHTYWLFKGNKSDVVKLYDLTSICNGASSDSKNPYTIPVTSLLYRIARNMIENGIRSRKEAVSAISLLQNCILLLEREEHPGMMMAANYLLAFLYMQDDFTDEETTTSDESQDEETSENQDEADCAPENEASNIPDVKSMILHDEERKDKKTPWDELNKEEKCRATIKFVIEALHCYGTVYTNKALQQRSHIDESSDKADSTESNCFKSDSSGNPTADTDTTESNSCQSLYPIIPVVSENSDLSVMQLYEKDLAMVVEPTLPSAAGSNWIMQLKMFGMNAYISLAELSISKGKYGRALRFLKIAWICMEYLVDVNTDDLLLTRAKLSMMCGDISLIFAHKRNVSQEDFFSYNQEDQDFLKLCASETSKSNELQGVSDIETMFQLDSEQLLIRTVGWYEKSLELSPSNDDKDNVIQVVAVTARLGNVRNELGVFYMNAATAMANGFGDPAKEEQKLWRKSFEYFEKGVQAFEVIDDRPNIALIHSNAARLMRLCAQSYGNSTRTTVEGSRGNFTQQEKLYFNKAFEFYQKAFASLRSRQTMKEIWDRISFELSGAYFAMACLMQDHAPLHSTAQEEVMKDVQSLMMKALHYCEDEEKNVDSPRYQIIRRRVGKIHHRIASIYQHAYRNKYQDAGSKKFRSLAELHYNKAYLYLADDTLAVEYLSTLTEHIALHMLNITSTTNILSNIKKLRAALLMCLKEENITALRNVTKSLYAEDNNDSLRIQREDLRNHERDRSVEMIEPVSKRLKDISNIRDFDDFNLEETFNLLEILERQLSNIFRELITCFSSKSAKGKTVDELSLVEVKKMYELYLRASAAKDNGSNIVLKLHEKGCLLWSVIEKLRRVAVLH